jgi:hypothetical protein
MKRLVLVSTLVLGFSGSLFADTIFLDPGLWIDAAGETRRLAPTRTEPFGVNDTLVIWGDPFGNGVFDVLYEPGALAVCLPNVCNTLVLGGLNNGNTSTSIRHVEPVLAFGYFVVGVSTLGVGTPSNPKFFGIVFDEPSTAVPFPMPIFDASGPGLQSGFFLPDIRANVPEPPVWLLLVVGTTILFLFRTTLRADSASPGWRHQRHQQ